MIGHPFFFTKQGEQYHVHEIKLDHNINVELYTTRDENLETGGSIWHASFLLTNYLIKHTDLVKGKTILELGSGCGLCGIVCSILGAKKVIITDLPEQQDHLKKNILNNSESLLGEVVSLPFTFGSNVNDLIQELQIQNVTLDSIDLIIGCDIGFDLSLHEPIVFSIKSLLKSQLCTLETKLYFIEESKLQISIEFDNNSSMERYFSMV